MDSDQITIFFNTLINDLSERLGFFIEDFLALLTPMRFVELILVTFLVWVVLRSFTSRQSSKVFWWLSILLLLILIAEIWQLNVLLFIALGLLLVSLFAFIFFNLDLFSVFFSFPGSLTLDKTTARKTIREVLRAVNSLTSSKLPSLIVVFPMRVNIPKSYLKSARIMEMPVNFESIVDSFRNEESHLAKGALLIKGDRIIAAGSKLNSKDRLIFNINQDKLQNIAKRFGALVIVTSGNKKQISLLYQDNSYPKASEDTLERLLDKLLIQ